MRAQRVLGTWVFGLLFVGLAAAGCTTAPSGASNTSKSLRPTKVTYNYTVKDRDCLKRAMYFESEHSDHDGYMAVGSVVMNRLTSGAYPPTICGIVAQEKQFAPGVMTREVKAQAEPELELAATSLLRGERHPGVKDAMFFHTQGLKYPYKNMHYVAVAGGNAFYEKRDQDGTLETPAPLPAYEVAMNYVPMQSVQAAQFPLLLPTEQQVPVPVVAPVPPTLPLPDAVAVATPVTPPIPAQVPIPLPLPLAPSDSTFDVAQTTGEAPPAAMPIPQPRPELIETTGSISPIKAASAPAKGAPAPTR